MDQAEVTKAETIERPPARQVIGPDSSSMMSAMIAAAKDIDVDKLVKLMDMQKQLVADQRKQEFSADFVQMKPHLPKVIRTKENTQTKSRYAPLDEINRTVDPVLERYGFGTATKVIAQAPDSVTVKAELWHRSGHIEETTVTMPLDNKGAQGTVNKTMPHATKSSITYAKTTAICALLNISTGEDTDGNESGVDDGQIVTNEQAVEIDLLMRETKTNKEKFLKLVGADSVPNISAKNYAKAMNILNERKKAKNASA